MKKFQLLSRILFSIVLSIAFCLSAFAQKTALPPELNKKSSLTDVLNWLDKMSFAQVRIGLESTGNGLTQPEDIPTSATSYSEEAVFSQGFKLSKIEGCKIVLTNDDIKILQFRTANPDYNKGTFEYFRKADDDQSKFTGELTIPLKEIIAKKEPFRYTSKTEKADLFGIWRTQFNTKSDFGYGLFIPTKKKVKEKIKEATERSVAIEISGEKLGDRTESMRASRLTFTLDDKEMSEKFYAALSQAVNICDEN